MFRVEWLQRMRTMGGRMNRPAKEGFDYIVERKSTDPEAKATADKWLQENETRLKWVEVQLETYARKKNP